MKTLQAQVTHHHSHQNINGSRCKILQDPFEKMIPNIKLSYEELSTILTRIEACLNSPPLSPASDDPNDLNPLTPGHFLIGAPLMTPTEPNVSHG